MNKILLYIGLAILLGTVTMVAPLALLEPEDSIPDKEYTPTVPEYTIKGPEEPNNQERAYENGGTLGNIDVWTRPEAPVEPEPTAPDEPSPQEPELVLLVVKTAETPSDLSPIGLMTIPSFLIALGVFVYLKKRMA